MKCFNMLGLLLLVGVNVDADVYLHNPTGSNNRLNGDNRDVQNQKRLFDSQNNQRGGYNVGGDGYEEGEATLTYIGGSSLNIQWTNQHECGGLNTGCDIILQYMCSDGLRDGTNTGTPNENNDNPSNGRHEDQQYYADCKGRQRDTNLYHADQKLNREDARSTRQNPNGNRNGLECPEERDYYPYHAPTPWRDIAILTNNVDKCNKYKAQSQNVIEKGYCKNANTRNRLQPITKADCKSAQGTWNLSPSHSLPAPDCQKAPESRDNHLGNTESTGRNDGRIPKTLSYTWSVPNIDATACALRIRYNMTVGDYKPFGVDKNNDNARNNEGRPNLDIGSEYGLPDPDDAKDRGYIMKNNPRIQPLSDTSRLDFQLAINTAQTGRTFEDRTHKFRITRKETVKSIPANAPVYNLNVIGKRGNIVQVFPAVEYGFEPAILKVKKGDIVHPQWTGSLRNPNNNDGEGRNKEDKNNIIAMTPRQYNPKLQPSKTIGHPGNSYPLKIKDGTFLGVDSDMAQRLAFPKEGQNVEIAVGGNAAFEEIGCFKDEQNRAIRGEFVRFDPSVVIQKCANKARNAGNEIFAVQYNIECFTDEVASEANAAQTYAKYGATTGCKNGRGGSWKQNVYKIVPDTAAGNGRKDEPANSNVEKVIAKDNEKVAPKGNWNFAETVIEVENDIKESDVQISSILDSFDAFDDEVTMENEKRGGGGDASKLDNAPAYVNVGPIQADTCGTYNYLCTRNNNFSNRSQKGKVIVC